MKTRALKLLVAGVLLTNATPTEASLEETIVNIRSQTQSSFDSEAKKDTSKNLEEAINKVRAKVTDYANMVLSQYDIQLNVNARNSYSNPFFGVIRINPNQVNHVLGETLEGALVHEVAHCVFGPYSSIGFINWVEKNVPMINKINIKGLLSDQERESFKKDYERYICDINLSKEENDTRNWVKVMLIEYSKREKQVESYAIIAQLKFNGHKIPEYMEKHYEKLFKEIPN